MEFGYVAYMAIIMGKKRNNSYLMYILAFLFMLVIVVF